MSLVDHDWWIGGSDLWGKEEGEGGSILFGTEFLQFETVDKWIVLNKSAAF